jgi:hypothetical protein
MAFCNSCGTTITQGTRFCSKCGAPILASGFPSSTPAGTTQPPPATPSSVPPSVAPPTQNNNALKIVLVVIGVIIVIGALGIGVLTVVGLHIAKNTRVRHEGDQVKVETPFGTVESSKDPDQVARNLGVDIYPGAEVQKDGAASASFGNLRTVNATFQSSDSDDKVCSFYKSRFPSAAVSTSEENHCTIVSNTTPPNVVTINIEANGGGSRIQISSVTKK